MRKIYAKLPPLSPEAQALRDRLAPQPEPEQIKQEVEERIEELPPVLDGPTVVLKP